MIIWVSMPSFYKNGLCNICADSRHHCLFDSLVIQVIVPEHYITREKTDKLVAVVKIMLLTELVLILHYTC